MTLEAAIRRLPRPFDPERGREVAAAIPGLTPGVVALVAGAAGCSPYLAGLAEREAQWLSDAVQDVATALEKEITAARACAVDEAAEGLRRSKRRIALLVGLGDLAGALTLQQVTGALTEFADAACHAALRAALTRLIRRGKLPGMTEADAESGAGMVVLAMGKMGAGELNYSSDIDLICLFDETRFDPADFLEARAAFGRATREMAATLGEITDRGYVFRVDLRLRPDPSVTPVCIAMEAAEHYYESLGRTWERAAYIKARPAAGDLSAGERFLRTLRPFVWRRHLDFATIRDAHDMRLAIREHKGLAGPITLAGHDMKLGRGGIREIEFFTQTRQLIAGGRDPDLRCRGTVEGLSLLARKGWIAADIASSLSDHYTAHRTVEHRLQMVQDARTHSLPRAEEGFARLAAMMDRDVEELKSDLRRRLEEVHALTEDFFAPDRPGAAPEPDNTSDFDREILNRWMSYPALRSARSRQIFDRLKPELLARLARAARPQEALLAFDGFLAGLPAGVQVFSLLEANPQLADLVVDITGTSPALAQYLARNAGVFDAVIGGDFFADWPGQAGLEALLAPVLAREGDYERQLDALRRWSKEWHFRIGVHLLRGLIGPAEASAQYTDLARSVLTGLWPLVIAEFSRRHGPPPGRGAVVVGMGSLGAGTLNAGSDLDLIVIYDPQGAESSDGEKALSTRPYYARLTQALITALTAPMAEGRLYEVDMRLRPSGNQGPVATSWQAFRDYQRNEAWVWEHLALCRARVVAGPEDLGRDVTSFQRDLLAAPRRAGDVAREVAQMCRRIREAKPEGALFEVKVGPGRLQEIELLSQAGALLSGSPGLPVADGIRAAAREGLLEEGAAEELASVAALLGSVHVATQLLADGAIDETGFGLAAQRYLARAAGQADFAALERALAQAYVAARAHVDAVMARFEIAEGQDEG